MPRRSAGELRPSEVSPSEVSPEILDSAPQGRGSLLKTISSKGPRRPTLQKQDSQIPLSDFPEQLRGVLSAFDKDGDATINSSELAEAAEAYVHKRTQAKRLKILAGVLVLVICLLVAANFVTSLMAAEMAKDTSTSPDTGLLTIKGSTDAVLVSAAEFSAPLSSYLPDETFAQLKHFTATSGTGAYVHIMVQGFYRLPAAQCLPPIVKLVTPAGAIHIQDTTLEFPDTSNSFFLEAGFVTEGAGPGRRRLSLSGLMGFYNTLHGIKTDADKSQTCTPKLPNPPVRIKTMSTTLQRCEDQCQDQYGFLLPNLAGVQDVGSVPYMASQESALQDQVVVHGRNLTRSITRTRLPRYPQLTKVRLNNGTHSASWLEYSDQKFYCVEQGANEVNDSMSSESVKAVTPTITFEGFTYYESSRYVEPVASLQYTMDYPSLGIKTKFFASASDVDKPLGIRTLELNTQTNTYEPSTLADFYDLKINAEVTEADTSDSLFAWPTDCITDPNIEAPPNPIGQEVGVGLITSDQSPVAWGQPKPPMQPRPAAAEANATNSTSHSGSRRKLATCENTCIGKPYWGSDGYCDDGGPGSNYAGCEFGTDCADCGSRATNPYGDLCSFGLLSGSRQIGPVKIQADACAGTASLSASGSAGFVAVSGEANFDWSDAFNYGGYLQANGYVQADITCPSIIGSVGVGSSSANKICGYTVGTGVLLSGRLSAQTFEDLQYTCQSSNGEGTSYSGPKWALGAKASLSIPQKSFAWGAAGFSADAWVKVVGYAPYDGNMQWLFEVHAQGNAWLGWSTWSASKRFFPWSTPWNGYDCSKQWIKTGGETALMQRFFGS